MNTHILTLNPAILRPLFLRWRFSLKTWLVLSLAFSFMLLFFYIFQVQEITKAGFFISTYEKQLAEFSQERQILEADFSYLNSSANLETILSSLDYERVGQVHYLRVPGATVVAK